jgi:hypothetical protein
VTQEGSFAMKSIMNWRLTVWVGSIGRMISAYDHYLVRHVVDFGVDL